MIKQFSLKNFKSYREAVLPLSTLTVLIGANASGKSNLIEAIRILAWLANGRRLGDLLQSIARDDISIRGSREIFFDQNNFELGCTLEDEIIDEFNHLSITLGIENKESDPKIIDEKILNSDHKFLYRIDSSSNYSHSVQVFYNNFSKGGNKPRIECNNQQAIFTQLNTPARFSKKAQAIIPKVVSTYQSQLENIMFLDPNPAKMRQYIYMHEKTINPDGSNVSSILYNITSRESNKLSALRFIQSLPEQNITDINYIRTPRNEVILKIEETFAGKNVYRDATLLSDGTLRVLAITAALLSAPPGSVVIIEEIDNGVHPSRAHDLINTIQRVAQERRLQVLITSHNPALLDALPLESIGDVVCCYRDPDEGDSRLVKLSQLSDYPELVARGSLGMLMTQGIIDKFVKDKRTDAQRVQEAMDWLQQLQQEVV